MKRKPFAAPLLASLLFSLPATQAATLVGLWEFNDSSDLGKASVGSDLTLSGVTNVTDAVAGVGGTDTGAAIFSVAGHAVVTNPIGVNGIGTTRTNDFTIVLDFKVPTFSTYTAFFDFDMGTGDADYFYRTNNASRFGLNASGVGMGYIDGTTMLTADTWHRLVLSYETGTARSVYLDGVLLGTHGTGADYVDVTRTTLGSEFRVSWDDNSEDSLTHYSAIALFDGALTETQVQNLGLAGTTIIPEPSTTLLGGLGAFFLFCRRRD